MLQIHTMIVFKNSILMETLLPNGAVPVVVMDNLILLLVLLLTHQDMFMLLIAKTTEYRNLSPMIATQTSTILSPSGEVREAETDNLKVGYPLLPTLPDMFMLLIAKTTVYRSLQVMEYI